MLMRSTTLVQREALNPTCVGRAPVVTARIMYALVFLLNVQCALRFVLWPDVYASSFELTGIAGAAAVQGLGVAFLMWNITYPAFIVNPLRFRSLGVVVLAQQAIGLVGELCILLSLPTDHIALSASIGRFIIFDASGLVLMGVAFAWLLLALHTRSVANNDQINS